MQEVIAQIFSYVWGIWRFRWLALITAWVVALAGWLFVYQMPEAYVASARIYVDSNNLLRPLLRGLAIEPNTEQRITMMSRTLLTRPNLEKVMRMSDLDLQVGTDLQKEEFLDDLQAAIRLSGDRDNPSLYSIKVKDESRDVAKRVAQSLITVFIESSLSDKRQDSSGAQDFLDDQIAEYEERLVQAEDRLAAFKQRHVGILHGDGAGYYVRLNEANSALANAGLQLREMENRRNELQRQIDGEEPVFLTSTTTSADTSFNSPLNARIQALSAELDTLLAKYTSRHPSVRQIQSLIRDLESEKLRDQQATTTGNYADAYAGLLSSPVYQGMRSMLAETNAQVAELSVRVEEYEQRVKELDSMVDSVPVIEAELKQLDRDYFVISEQHQELLQRREAAKLSQDVERNASDVTFRVIDPPFVPSVPSEPNKLLLNSGVLVVALGIGAGMALLISLIKPVIVDPQSLTRLTGLPLLGAVTLLPTREEKKREAIGLAAYSSMFAVLILVYVGMNVGKLLMAS